MLKVQTRQIAVDSACDLPPLVMLHGWGSHSAVWQPLLAAIENSDADARRRQLILLDLPGFGVNADIVLESLEALYESLLSVLPTRCDILGWSLGGMIATAMVARFPKRFRSLVTIACNPCFVSSACWPHATDPDVLANFIEGFTLQPKKTFTRFTQLQVKGDVKAKSTLTFLRGIHEFSEVEASDRQLEAWLFNLKLLNDIDNRECLANLAELKVPMLNILGENDALVPCAIATTLMDAFPQERDSESGTRVNSTTANKTAVIEGAAHVPHVSFSETTADLIQNFHNGIEDLVNGDVYANVCNYADNNYADNNSADDPYKKDKKTVARSFSRAATEYDALAELQRIVANKMLALMPASDFQGLIGDLGCGTAYCLEHIDNADNQLIGLDIAQGMLQVSRHKLADRGISWVCGDIEQLPMKTALFDGLVSSLSMQWCDRLDALFGETYRVLKPGGWMLFTSLGPRTLNELHDAWGEVDDYVHVNHFATFDRVQEALQVAGFDILHAACEDQVMSYQRVLDLMRELKGIGAHNVNGGQNRGLTTRAKLRQLDTAYEKVRANGVLPATYDVQYYLVQKQVVRANSS